MHVNVRLQQTVAVQKIKRFPVSEEMQQSAAAAHVKRKSSE